ncbi:hypothetical protein BTZ20_1275 [Rhodococcus sp. MTM3W5.2]|nr:hypothetical protein BTZ20_1275 [Rhodococcus sp. MTM3W5.2]
MCSALIGERGGVSPHTSSIRAWALRLRPGLQANATSRLRALAPGNGTSSPPRRVEISPKRDTTISGRGSAVTAESLVSGCTGDNANRSGGPRAECG